MVRPLLCLEKVGFISSCFRDIFLVKRGKIILLSKVLIRTFWKCCTVLVVCTQKIYLANGGLLIRREYEKGLEGIESLHAVFELYFIV